MNSELSEYLRSTQYRDSGNLSARAALHIRYGTNGYPWHRWVFDHMRELVPEAARVLELGAGPAWLWRENAARVPEGWQVTVSDFSAGMVDEQRSELAPLGLPCECRVIDAQQIPLEADTLDCVVANHMLYHVEDRERALGEIRRALKPGGVLLAATNGEQHLHELSQLIKRHVATHRNLARRFTLENGAAQILGHFDSVETLEYPDGLVVTELQPILDYIRSMGSLRDVDASIDAAIEDELLKHFERHKKFTIRKAVGMFVAR